MQELNPTINELENRFEVYVDDLLCEVVYEREDNVVSILGTHVPKALEGRGIAAALTKYALEYIKSNGLKLVPVCSYTQVYVERHPEYQDLLDK